MSFVVSSLTDYVIENVDVLVSKSIFGARTSEVINSEGTTMTGIKFAEQINILDTDAIFQDGAGCTRTASGTTTITQRKLTVGYVAVVEDICVKDLRKKYLSKALKPGSQENDLSFEKEYTDLKALTIAKQLEVALWQGDTTSGFANLARFDGLIKLIDGGSPIDGNPTSINTVINVSNVKGIVDNMWLKLPSDLMGRDDIRIFCGWDTFNTFISAFTTLNLFNFAPTGKEVQIQNGEVIIPGTSYRLTAVHGLDGTNRLFTIRMSNLFLGTDLLHEEEDWSIMEDQFKDYLRFKVQFKLGVNVAFTNEVVSFKFK